MKNRGHIKKWYSKTILAALIGTTLLLATPLSAQEAEVVVAGKREFRHSCALCHGLGGKGESVMTTLNLLTIKPSDLTQLSKKNHGQFPFWRVYRIIDGHEEVKGHGTQDMPIWGTVFTQQEDSNLAGETRAIGRILEVVYYLRSIQEKQAQGLAPKQ